jgi:hypothetical protein
MVSSAAELFRHEPGLTPGTGQAALASPAVAAIDRHMKPAKPDAPAAFLDSYRGLGPLSGPLRFAEVLIVVEIPFHKVTYNEDAIAHLHRVEHYP